MGFRRCVRYMHASRSLLQSKRFCSFCSRANKRRTKKHVAHRASPRHRHAHARCPAPCTRARACRARSTRTHHACAPRQPCKCSHAATRAHVKKLGSSRARVTGHWPTVGRPAAGTSGAHTRCKHARHLRCVRSPCIADMLCMPSTSTVARCHRTAERHDDNERDEDERHDAEDREHDGRSQRVRVRSRLPLSRAKAHAHARCQASRV